MRLIIENIYSVRLYHLSEILSVKYNLPFGFIMRLWFKTGKLSMIKFEEELKRLFNGTEC